jgi:hypothetical protein
MTINAYCTKLKRLADQLRDIGHPVSEPNQVLNLLRGLNPKYRYVKPVITSKYPPHTFMSARSFLILEELGADHDANTEATQALAASHGERPGGSSGNHGASFRSTDGSSGSSAPRDNNRRNSGGRPNNRGDRRRGRGNGGGSARGGHSNNQAAPYAAGYNPWQGMVQAWPMPFRAPGTGVLGPRPPFQPQQAMTAAHHQPSSGAANPYDMAGLYPALHSAGTSSQPQSTSDWYFDTGAISHMSSSPGNFPNSVLQPFSSKITVGNGAQMPVTHRAQTVIPTATSPLHLNDVLVSPSLIKNLISVRRPHATIMFILNLTPPVFPSRI